MASLEEAITRRSPSRSYNEKLWMLDLLKAVTYPPS